MPLSMLLNLEAEIFQTQNLNIQPGCFKVPHVCQYQYIAAYIRPPIKLKVFDIKLINSASGFSIMFPCW